MLFAMSGLAQDSSTIVVIGLSQDAAVLKIDGEYRVLRVGETSPEGVVLISADTEQAILEQAGCRKTYQLSKQNNNSQINSTNMPSVHIQPNAQGLYRVAGEINGLPVVFLVDTGATNIAMSSIQAAYLGLMSEQNDDKKGKLAITTSGAIKTYRIQLEQVKVGSIRVNHLEAVIFEGEYPLDILLGMNFLAYVDIHREDGLLELRQRN